MKADLYSSDGSKKGSVELPKYFEAKVIPHLIKRAYDAELSLTGQPYGNFYLSGKLVSASGKIKHARAGYRSHYGKGISRVPRKTMNRRGERRFWVGAFAPGTRGGRPAHPPVVVKNNEEKINRKEMKTALYSAISASEKVIVIEDKFEDFKKIKEVIAIIEKIIPKNERKSSLIVTDKEMRLGNLGINFTTAKKLSLTDIAPQGIPKKTVLWTEKAIKELK